MIEAERQASPDAISTAQFPERIFLISQAENPWELKKVLLKSAISNGWISMLVNINAAMFAGLISLTADFGALNSIIFLLAQFGTTFIGTIIILFLQIRQQNNMAISAKVSERLLVFVDLFVMLGWGVGSLVFLSPESYHLSLLVIVLLTTAGIGAATLNSRLMFSLISGRIMLFLPCMVYFLLEQPPFWGLFICTLFFATIVSVGIGYAVHVQHLNEANYGIKLRKFSVLLEQQSFSLERSLLLRHEAQANLLKATKLRERFLHSINHDLNQPLSAMALYLNNLQGQVKASASDTVTAAKRCLTSAKSLIQSMSQLAWISENLPPPKIISLELQPLINQIAQDTALIAAEKNVTIRNVPTSLTVLADTDYLERVLRNLVHNAIQYSREGRIVMGVRHRPDGYLEIVVADDGLGISKEHQDKIFEEFYQIDIHTSRRLGNIGLGLTIVRDLVAAMNGSLTLKSIKNEGTLFAVRLPVSKDLRQPSAAGMLKEPQSINAKKVLLVEDQEKFLRDISAMVVAAGCQLETASSPNEIKAITGEKLQQFDYLIFDFNLGEKLTAFDLLCRSEKNLLSRSLIISQFDNPEVIFTVKENGGRFLKKPFSETDLKNALSALNSSGNS